MKPRNIQGPSISVKDDNPLPQLAGTLFLTDGGIETALIFHEGFDLPCFAAFHLLQDDTGQAALVRYYERYIANSQSLRRRLCF